MQDDPLNLAHILEHAARFHGRTEVVTRRVEDGSIHRYTYSDAIRRTRKLANALKRLGVRPGDRVATMGSNTHRHLESWYAIAGQGAICHTLNPRLFAEQIEYIVNHAADSIVLVDPPFVPLLERLQDRLPTVRRYVVLTDEAHMPRTSLAGATAYEPLIADEAEEFEWPSFPEETASSLCYTSGTTGNPKGVLYTHRSNFLHAYAINAKDVLGAGCHDVVLMVVPMYHANSWGLAYAGPMAGAKLVLLGDRLDGAAFTSSSTPSASPGPRRCPPSGTCCWPTCASTACCSPTWKRSSSGGSAAPRSMIAAFDREYGVTVVHGWGMTEMSPMGTTCRLRPFMRELSYERQLDVRAKQGCPLFGVSMRIVDDAGDELPHDGKAAGRLLVRGPWVVKRYYKHDRDATDADGWFDTGDIATIDEHGYMQIADRAKDLIKSGGEWISSVVLENTAMGHPQVALAAVIGVYHPVWEERPLLIVKPAVGPAPRSNRCSTSSATRSSSGGCPMTWSSSTRSP